MLSLIVSTYRSDRQVEANLAYLDTFADEDLHIVFSDCSGDPKKHEYLLRLSAENPCIKAILHPARVSLYSDISSLIRLHTADSEYIAICGDDDYVSLDYLRHSLSVLKAQKQAVCSLGNYIICLSNKSTAIDSRSFMENSALERVRNGFTPKAYNTFFFAVFRHKALLPWANFCADHPLIAGFFDFIHCISLLAQGKIIAHDHGHYLWTGENWETAEKQMDSRERHYQAAGVPRNFYTFHHLHFAMECVNFLLGRHSPVKDNNEALACAQIAWDRCMELYKKDVRLNEATYLQLLKHRSQAIEALRHLIHLPACNDPQRIACFVEILSCFSVPMAQRYREFDFGLRL